MLSPSSSFRSNQDHPGVSVDFCVEADDPIDSYISETSSSLCYSVSDTTSEGDTSDFEEKPVGYGLHDSLKAGDDDSDLSSTVSVCSMPVKRWPSPGTMYGPAAKLAGAVGSGLNGPSLRSRTEQPLEREPANKGHAKGTSVEVVDDDSDISSTMAVCDMPIGQRSPNPGPLYDQYGCRPEFLPVTEQAGAVGKGVQLGVAQQDDADTQEDADPPPPPAGTDVPPGQKKAKSKGWFHTPSFLKRSKKQRPSQSGNDQPVLSGILPGGNEVGEAARLA
mmetsp:Transcript_137730/g.427923  ORF Transcript_137730/g.427923 Transcript_137730/m.427923 type:complete len:277 (-) Transcript_137730:94-924(-)